MLASTNYWMDIQLYGHTVFFEGGNVYTDMDIPFPYNKPHSYYTVNNPSLNPAISDNCQCFDNITNLSLSEKMLAKILRRSERF